MPTRPDLSTLTPVEPESATQIGVSDVPPAAEPVTIRAEPDAAEPAAPAAPARPQRPSLERRTSPFTTHLNELRAAFPDSDASVCRGVLVASGDNLETAFTGMLAISDPSIRPPAHAASQIANDERLARKLALSDQRRQSRPRSRTATPQAGQAAQPAYDDDDESEFQRGLNETRQAVSSFWGSLKQKLTNEIYDDEAPGYEPARGRRSGSAEQPWFSRDSGYHDADAAPAANLPPLPPRARRPAAAERSVNVFGDDSSSKDAAKKPEEPEPDAFFIGESDEDLGSLDGDKSESVPGSSGEPKENASAGAELVSASVANEPTAGDADAPTAVGEDDGDAKAETTRRDSSASRRSSAKEALTKLKLSEDKSP